MKTNLRFILILIGLIVIQSICVAESTSIITIPDCESLVVKDCCITEDGNIILAGQDRASGDGVLMMSTFDGQLLGTIYAKNTGDGCQYDSIGFTDADSYIALRATLDGDANSVVECIQNGSVVGATEPITGASHIKTIDNGFLVCGTPRSIPDSLKSVIIMKGMDGQTKWQISLKEMLTFQGIASSIDGEVHVLYGDKTERWLDGDTIVEGEITGFAIGIDNGGNILWRHDIPEVKMITGAVFDKDGNLYLAGDNRYSGFVYKYSPTELTWAIEYPFVIVTNDTTYNTPGRISDIIIYNDQIYFAANQSGMSGLYLVCLNVDGLTQREQLINTGDWGNVGFTELLLHNDKLHLLVNGRMISTDPSIQYANIPYITYLQIIE